MKVFELMTRPVVTCRVEDSTQRAAQLMWEHDCGALPVVDVDGKLVGVITDRDICMSAHLHGTPLAAIGVGEAMAHQVYTCRAGDSLEAAEHLMTRHQIRRLPIVDDANRPIGFLSLGDIARHTSHLAHAAENGQALLRTFAAVCQPRPDTVTAHRSEAEQPEPKPVAI